MRMLHTMLRVGDLDRAVKFYTAITAPPSL
jgi:catechol 2,3-dioxygenase-like lactoylglutathione lyase family enzyme